MTKNWSLSNILVNGMSAEKRPAKERDIIWASEIGKSYYDRYWKMKGVEPTNEFSARSYFKFLIGDIIESGVELILDRAGFTVELQKDKEKCRLQLPDCFPVEGKYDAILSSDGDWDGAYRRMIDDPHQGMFAYVDKFALALNKFCKAKYPEGLERQLFEIKTINSMMFKSRMMKGTLRRDYSYYYMQLYTYMKYLGADRGNILYISKDDGLFFVDEVDASPDLEQQWTTDIQEITRLVQNDIVPDFPEPYLLQDGKYKVNYSALGSSFLTLHTGKSLEEYKKEIDTQVKELNKLLKKESHD